MTAADFQIEETRDGARLRLVGHWTATALGRTPRRLADALSHGPVVTLDISDLGKFDTSGALALVQASNGRLPKAAWKGRDEVGRIYAMVEKLERNTAPPPRRPLPDPGHLL